MTPVLRVTSASASFPFYVQGLGFTVDWEYRHEPDFPVFAQLTRGDQTIFLRTCSRSFLISADYADAPKDLSE
nr:glyoxalase superfamily protein [Xanthomonas campestris]